MGGGERSRKECDRTSRENMRLEKFENTRLLGKGMAEDGGSMSTLPSPCSKYPLTESSSLVIVLIDTFLENDQEGVRTIPSSFSSVSLSSDSARRKREGLEAVMSINLRREEMGGNVLKLDVEIGDAARRSTFLVLGGVANPDRMG